LLHANNTMNKFGQPIWAIECFHNTNKTCQSRGENGADKKTSAKEEMVRSLFLSKKSSTDHSRKATMQQLHVCEAENYDFYARSR